MNGLVIPATGTNNKICIHFLGGARGDFLASVLLDTFAERLNGAVYQPDYLKIHHDFNEVTIPNEYTVIRIDDNKSIDNIMQITANGFLKDPVTMLDDTIDHFYTRIKDTHYNRREIIDLDKYDYWIDFASVNDIDFLKDLYYQFHSQPISNSQLTCIEENISKQIKWQTVSGLQQLSWLIEFEIKFNLLNWCKTFSIQEYMSADNPESLLTIKNYSKEPFVL
jgi:hypothetical protein